MKKNIICITFLFIFMFLFMTSNVYAGGITVNKDEVIADGPNINNFSASYESFGGIYSNNWTSDNDTDVLLHIKYYLTDKYKDYASLLGIVVDGVYYSKEQAIAAFPSLEIINWSYDCIEYKIQFHVNKDESSSKYGVVEGFRKLPDNVEAAYFYTLCDYELFYMTDLETPHEEVHNRDIIDRIIDKRNVDFTTSIANIENGVVDEYSKYATSVKKDDEVSVKVVLDRPYGVLNSSRVTLTGEIPEGFSYISGSASYTNSAGYPDALTIDESTGVPILIINNMPVGENTVFTFKMKAEEDAKNVTDTVVFENTMHKVIVPPASLKDLDPSWYPDPLYNEDEYIKKDYNYINTAFNVMYDSNGGNGEVIDNNSYVYNDDGTTAIILGSSSVSKEGYEFKGWNTNSDGSGDFYYEGDKVSLTKDILLYAIWEPIQINDNKNINDDSNITNNPSTADNIYNILVLLFSSLIALIIFNKYLFKIIKQFDD